MLGIWQIMVIGIIPKRGRVRSVAVHKRSSSRSSGKHKLSEDNMMMMTEHVRLPKDEHMQHIGYLTSIIIAYYQAKNLIDASRLYKDIHNSKGTGILDKLYGTYDVALRNSYPELMSLLDNTPTEWTFQDNTDEYIEIVLETIGNDEVFR